MATKVSVKVKLKYNPLYWNFIYGFGYFAFMVVITSFFYFKGELSCALLIAILPYILLPVLFLTVLILNLVKLVEWKLGSRIILSIFFAVIVSVIVILILHFVFFNILRTVPIYQISCSV